MNVMRPLCRGLLSNSSHFCSASKLPPLLATTGVRTRSFGIRGTKPKMGNNKEDEKNNIQTNPRVNKIQQLIHHHSSSDTTFPLIYSSSDERTEQEFFNFKVLGFLLMAFCCGMLMHHVFNLPGGWEKCWEEGATPWDLGKPTPVIVHLRQLGALPKGRALVPGCGTGYDLVAMASPERHVVGLEISDIAINKAKELFSSLPSANYITVLKADFFTWCPTELFDLIFDYTFFCAIEPEMRSAWAQKISDFLKLDGELITLMFPISDHVGGPPYKVSVSDYEEVLYPIGFQATSIVDNELAVGPRRVCENIIYIL
ncbi:hypothetical protein Patl1_26049 [Pistacia atlantica]|uniref:Uncharacterized protein n=1 Tax=Pistacia atlantica TaxID=434234 RepID=A0ACC1B212_9ROSI|nr:hypothetical protein Patl1_26049 [Pistacia atlantica]